MATGRVRGAGGRWAAPVAAGRRSGRRPATAGTAGLPRRARPQRTLHRDRFHLTGGSVYAAPTAHVTFIHGISNKPPADALLDLWVGTLADGELHLLESGVTCSMVYWADLLYPEPVAQAMLEAAETQLIEEELPDIGLRWVVEAEDEEAAFIARLADRIGFEELASDDPALPPPEPTPGELQDTAAGSFEALPVPWVLKRPLMKIFLRDVHHYLFDVAFTPRPGETHRIQTEIRRRAIAALQDGDAADGRHVVVAHSLGSVIAYDCLKRVPGCPAVDGLLTIGSPLGLSEVQDRLRPGWSRDDGFPDAVGRWVNVFDRLDPVAGLDPELADEYRDGRQPRIEDVHEPNEGTWRHGIVKYLRGPALRDHLRQMLEL